MTEEALQTIEDEQIENPELETPEPEQGETKQDDPAGFTKRINQKHFELMEEKRAREAAEAEIARLKAQIPENLKPVIPPLPDPYDDDYDIRIAERENAIKQLAIYEAQESVRQAEIEARNRTELEKRQSALINAVNAYTERAKSLDIGENELQVAGKTVAAYGINEQVAEFILHDDKGPAITAFLAKNPSELELIAKLNPLQAAIHISNNIKGKLSIVRSVDLPDPPETLNGGGVTKSERGPRGAKYE